MSKRKKDKQSRIHRNTTLDPGGPRGAREVAFGCGGVVVYLANTHHTLRVGLA